MASSLSLEKQNNNKIMAVKNNKGKVKESNKKVEDSGQTEESSSSAQNDSQEEGDAKSEVSAEEKYSELNNRFLRLYAEFENFRKRTNKERLDLITNANADLLKELIPVIDDFERAIANNKDSQDVVAIKEGFSLIYSKYKGILESKGLKPMDAVGKVFDSEIHEAIANLPTDDKKLKGKVIEAVEKGYLLNEQVLRYAKVVVGQ